MAPLDLDNIIASRQRVLEDSNLLYLIFGYLDPASVKKAALVSRLWRDIILSDSGKFWRWANLRVDYLSQYSVINSRMLYIVPAIKISWNTSLGMVESLLQAVSEGETPVLKQISATALTQVSPEILAGAAANLERLQVDHLSSTQLKFILAKIAGSQDSKLRKLTCAIPHDLSGMDPDILADAVVRLENGNFLPLLLSPAQVLSLFTRIRDSPHLRLTDLAIDWDISMVPPEMFAGAISRLETVWIHPGAGVKAGQLKSLFVTLISHQEGVGGPKLKHFELGTDEDLSSISPEVLVGAIQRLEVVSIWRGRTMTADQITAVLTMLKENQQGRLKDIRIYGIGRSVSPTLLQEARMNNAVFLLI